MNKSNPMICADCGVAMNHHAMKIDPRVDETEMQDALTGGALMEAHACPECGRTALRAA